jgi:hypothetical protein
LICTICFSILLSSCNENVDHEFSHDSTINSWVKANKQEILNYTRKDIKSFSEKKQKAILRVMPANKKKEIWQEKVDYLLKMNLSKEEKVYIKWFAEALKKMDYKAPISDKFTEELDEKVTIGAKKFNWSKEFVRNSFFKIGDVNLGKTDVELKSYQIQSRVGEPETCTCRSSYWGCTGINNDCNKPDTCKYANTDCGVFGTSRCTGYCTDEITSI